MINSRQWISDLDPRLAVQARDPNAHVPANIEATYPTADRRSVLAAARLQRLDAH